MVKVITTIAPCCVYVNCSCNSLDIALASLTSNVLIYITTDVTLSSLIKVADVLKFSIIRYNSLNVNCRNNGGMHFTFSSNFIFKGINLSGCSSTINYHTKLGPGLNLIYSYSDSKLYSIGPVLVLLLSKNVTISSCRFSNNEGACMYLCKKSKCLSYWKNFVHK